MIRLKLPFGLELSQIVTVAGALVMVGSAVAFFYQHSEKLEARMKAYIDGELKDFKAENRQWIRDRRNELIEEMAEHRKELKADVQDAERALVEARHAAFAVFTDTLNSAEKRVVDRVNLLQGHVDELTQDVGFIEGVVDISRHGSEQGNAE